MIFVTCLWRKILKYINSSCFSVQIPDNWKLIAVFSVLSKLSYKNPVGEMIQMDLSSPDQHDTVCSGTAGTVRPVTRRDPAVLIKLFLTSAHMTWRLATCPVTSTLHVGCNTHINSDGPVRQRDRSSEQTSSRNNNDQCDMSWYPAVTQAVHSVCPHWRQLVVWNTWSKNKSISSQSQPQFLKVSLKVLCSAPCGSSHFLSVTWYDDDMIYISTSPALSPAVQIKGQSASLRVRADLRFVFLFFHHHTFVFLKRNEHYSLTAALMQIQIINYISHLKSRFFMSYVSVCWRYDALYIFSLGVVTTSLSHYLI